MEITETINEEEGHKLINQSKLFLNTPFLHLGREPGLGLDCAGNIMKSLELCGFDSSFDVKNYGRYPNGTSLREIILDYCVRVKYEDARDGDIVLFSIDKNPQHLSFFFKNNGYDFIIHAQNELSKKGVVITRIDEYWKKKMVGVFRFKSKIRLT